MKFPADFAGDFYLKRVFDGEQESEKNSSTRVWIKNKNRLRVLWKTFVLKARIL